MSHNPATALQTRHRFYAVHLVKHSPAFFFLSIDVNQFCGILPLFALLASCKLSEIRNQAPFRRLSGEIMTDSKPLGAARIRAKQPAYEAKYHAQYTQFCNLFEQ